jgi:hypothetical protein
LKANQVGYGEAFEYFQMSEEAYEEFKADIENLQDELN